MHQTQWSAERPLPSPEQRYDSNALGARARLSSVQDAVQSARGGGGVRAKGLHVHICPQIDWPQR